jgi:hypothetical protein
MLRKQVEQLEALIRNAKSENSQLHQQFITMRVEMEGEQKLLQMQLKSAQDALALSSANLKMEQTKNSQLTKNLHTLEIEKLTLSQQVRELS